MWPSISNTCLSLDRMKSSSCARGCVRRGSPFGGSPYVSRPPCRRGRAPWYRSYRSEGKSGGSIRFVGRDQVQILFPLKHLKKPADPSHRRCLVSSVRPQSPHAPLCRVTSLSAPLDRSAVSPSKYAETPLQSAGRPTNCSVPSTTRGFVGVHSTAQSAVLHCFGKVAAGNPVEMLQGHSKVRFRTFLGDNCGVQARRDGQLRALGAAMTDWPGESPLAKPIKNSANVNA
jgi:hypothetical protein